MSQKMGLSSDAYQEWDFIMQHCGTSIEALKPSIKTLANAAEAEKESFEKLGITQEQLATLSQEDLFALTIARLQEMEEGTERTAIASELLGRGATELGALLNTSAEDTEAMRQQVHELGGVMSTDAVKAAAAYKDSLQNLQTAISGAKNNLSAELLPAVTEVMDGLTMIFSGEDLGAGVEKISKGIDELSVRLTEMIPAVMQVGCEIIMTLAQAILDNLPTIIDTGLQIINDVVQGIIAALPQILEAGMQIILGLVDACIQNLPMLVDVAIQMLVTLANSITAQIPTLLPAIIDVIITIVSILIDNLPMLIEAAITLFMGIVTGLMQALPQIIAALPILIDSLINALVDATPLLIDCGVLLFLAIIENLPAITAAICKAAPQIVKSLVRGFLEISELLKDAGKKLMVKLKEGLLGMLSSLISAATDIGKNIVEGIWNGISAGWDWLIEKIGSLAKGLFDKAKSALGIAAQSKKVQWLGEMCVAGFDDGAEKLMEGTVFGSAVNNTLGTVVANTGREMYGGNGSQTFNFYDTQTSPDAIRRRVQNTMTFGMAGGI